MFKIDTESNRISRVETKRFVDLGFRERDHLQEWLANQPDALGEELLIIQKEFAGFNDTNERLDLLALDKEGNLVIIENKLDDTGRDVTWQALKYASYCSTLTNLEIVEIYQSYLEKNCGGGDAKSLLCDFLDVEDLSELVLNVGTNQRLMLVAAKFRKEVTSTVLWLLKHNIQVKCFKVTPYAMDQECILKIEQIIPVPEVEDLMIRMNAKEAEQKNAEVETSHRHEIITVAFWEKALEVMKSSQCDLFNNISPRKDGWLGAGSGIGNCLFALIFHKKEVGVQFAMKHSEAIENKAIFDSLFEKKEQIEEIFCHELDWNRLDTAAKSRIQFKKEFDSYNKENWPEIIEWLVDSMTRMEQAFKQPLQDIKLSRKSSIKHKKL